MSIKITSAVWESGEFQGATFQVLLALADSASDEGWCWPKIETIQWKSRCAKRSVYKAITNLIAAGWLEKEVKQDGQIFYRVTPIVPLCPPERNRKPRFYRQAKPAVSEPEPSASGAQVSAPDAQPSAPRAQSSAPRAQPPHPLLGRTVIEPSLNRKEQKPSRDKRGTTHSVDQRHAVFKAMLGSYWSHRNPEIDMTWDGAEAGQLARMLKANPTLGAEQFKRLLNHRARSEVNHAERVYLWLPHVTKYGNGPLNQYGNPKDGANGTDRHGLFGKGKQANDALKLVHAWIDEKYGTGDPGQDTASESHEIADDDAGSDVFGPGRGDGADSASVVLNGTFRAIS